MWYHFSFILSLNNIFFRELGQRIWLDLVLMLFSTREWKPIRWYMPTFFLNLANQKSYLQIQPIKCPAQNKISTSTLWCLCDYHVAYQEIVKLKPLVLFACLNWIICCTFYGVAGWGRKYKEKLHRNVTSEYILSVCVVGFEFCRGCLHVKKTPSNAL